MNETADSMDRRGALTALGVGAGFLATAAISGSPNAQGLTHQAVGGGVLTAKELGWDAEAGRFVVPDLPYAYDALEAAIDEQTMRIHHGRHHAGYVRGLNGALDRLDAVKRGESIDAAGLAHDLAFHGGGAVNHAIFWQTMAPGGRGGGGEPTGLIGDTIDRDFGSFANFKALFSDAAGSVRGSGWAWLVFEPVSKRLLVMHMHDQQDAQLNGSRPVLGIDVWEHAYYLRYQNRRGEYITKWWSVVNWPKVSELLARVM
ncbi:MAG: superoxide dismutase [Planctomycetota bacterium]